MRECCTSCGVQPWDSSPTSCLPDFNQRTPCGVRRGRILFTRSSSIFQSNAPHAGCISDSSSASNLWHGFQSNAPRAGCDPNRASKVAHLVQFQSNAPRAGCDSKTIQFKRILATRRMYSFANYVLHILKHSPTYCIGTTLQPLIFGAKLPVILCQLNVRTILITLLYHTSLLPASAFAAIKSHRPNGVMRVKYT